MLIDERYCLIPGPLLQVSRLHMQQLVLKIEVWLSEFTWLAYSNIYNGAFCKWCVVFAPQIVSRSANAPGSLVSRPHCN